MEDQIRMSPEELKWSDSIWQGANQIEDILLVQLQLTKMIKREWERSCFRRFWPTVQSIKPK